MPKAAKKTARRAEKAGRWDALAAEVHSLRRAQLSFIRVMRAQIESNRQLRAALEKAVRRLDQVPLVQSITVPVQLPPEAVPTGKPFIDLADQIRRSEGG